MQTGVTELTASAISASTGHQRRVRSGKCERKAPDGRRIVRGSNHPTGGYADAIEEKDYGFPGRRWNAIRPCWLCDVETDVRTLTDNGFYSRCELPLDRTTETADEQVAASGTRRYAAAGGL